MFLGGEEGLEGGERGRELILQTNWKIWVKGALLSVFVVQNELRSAPRSCGRRGRSDQSKSFSGKTSQSEWNFHVSRAWIKSLSTWFKGPCLNFGHSVVQTAEFRFCLHHTPHAKILKYTWTQRKHSCVTEECVTRLLNPLTENFV